MKNLRATIAVLTALLIAGCASVQNHERVTDRDTSDYEYGEVFGQSQGNSPETNNLIATDVWVRLRHGFRLGGTEHRQVTRQIAAYSKRPEQIEKIFKRASPYMAYISAKVEQRGFPTDLALLPFIESGYDPFAYSRSRAAGLWQFIPDTGKIYGLEQDWWYDGRRDVVASTRAALDHLSALHREFGGDWLLALAAYNAGSGTIQAAINRNTRAGKPADFWHLKLPRETTDYVPRLLAIREIVRYPDRYGVTLTPIDPTPAFTMVDIDSQIDLGVAAKLAGMETGELLMLNPGYNRLATHPRGSHQLAIPVEKRDTFVDNLENLPDEKRSRSVRHKVAQGETLSRIAKRYNTTVTTLQQSNNLNGSLIKPGKELLVSTTTSEPNRLAIVPQQRVEAKAQAKTKSQPANLTHTVQGGENLWNISRKYSVSVDKLRAWNKLTVNSVIKTGQHLLVQGQAAQKNAQQTRTIRYTVKRGDSLYAIAKKYDVTVENLRHWNNLSRDSSLQPGQRIKVRVNATNVALN
jgi:membrane-bound lytic murein transglycosylase D